MEAIAYIYTIVVKAVNKDIPPEQAIELIRQFLSL